MKRKPRGHVVAGLVALGCAAGIAAAQTVEFRIIERQGQSAIVLPPGATAQTDAALCFAVQARVVGGVPGVTGLAGFQFDIALAGESDASGTLRKLVISNSGSGTYNSNATQVENATLGRGGLAAAYIYLAGINNAYNGPFNISNGTFTNGPDQEIGLVNGMTTGSTVQMFTDPTGNSRGWPNPSIGRAYFGVGRVVGGCVSLQVHRY